MFQEMYSFLHKKVTQKLSMPTKFLSAIRLMRTDAMSLKISIKSTLQYLFQVINYFAQNR